MYQRILVPFDGSATSSRGLDEAIGIATLTGASLRLIHMLDILDFTNGFETAAIYTDHVIPFMRRTGEEILQGGKARAENAGVRADTVLLEGMKTRLCDAVAEQARAWGADLIVTSARTGGAASAGCCWAAMPSRSCAPRSRRCCWSGRPTRQRLDVGRRRWLRLER